MTQELILFGDFEVQSQTNLVVEGLGRYLVDPTTKAYCFAFRLPGMACADLWDTRKPAPRAIVSHVTAGGLFVAHNAPFDYWIWNKVLRRQWPQLPELVMPQVRCSAARARYNGLPGSLEGACNALALPIRKDVDGKKNMLEIAFNVDWTPDTHPEQFARVFSYAGTDVDAMVGVWENTNPLPPREQAYFEMDMRINDRGFGVDVEAAEAMEELKVLAGAQLDYQVTVLTQGGVLAVTEVAKIKEFVGQMDTDIEVDDASKEALKKIVARPDIPDDLRQLLELRLDASRAPKKSAAILRAHVGGRLQHSTIYHGALSGRSTARGAGGAQTLNVARPRPGKSAELCEQFLEAARHRDIAFLSQDGHGPILAALADAQRSLFKATLPGHTLIGADLTGIETRMVPWLANDEPMLVEIESGVDGYKVEASNIYDKPYAEINKDQRQVGKVVRLALGFGGGVGAFTSMAANYGVYVEEPEAERIVWKFREAHPALERWWAVLEYAVLIALDTPGREVRVPIGRGFCTEAVFVRDGRALRMHLPSGRSISYYNARLHLEPGAHTPTAIYDKPEGYVETLDRKILSNNMTQGLARDDFWEVLLDVDQIENIVHHVYDEAILEVPVERAELRLEQLIGRMSIAPAWAPGLPLAAAGYVNLRWKKD